MDANRAWLGAMADVMIHGNPARPRGMEVREILNKTTVLDIPSCVVTLNRRKMGYRFMAAEALWILQGDSRVETILPWAAHLGKFTDDGHRFQGAYGPMVQEQLRYVVDMIAEDSDTRQAVMTVWRQNPRTSKDIPCTISLQFIVRNHTIHCVANMRSSDLWLGWVYDVFNFSMITAYVALMLRHDRKMHGLQLGKLHLNAGSQHIYARNFDDVQAIIGVVDELNSKRDQSAWSYSPLDVSLFDSPLSLLAHLHHLRERHWAEVRHLKELESHVS